MDDLDFESTGPVRVAGRFRPKVKPKSRKVASSTAASNIPDVVTENSTPVPSTVSDTVPSATSSDLVGSCSMTSEIVGSLEPSGKNEHLCSNVLSLDSVTKPSKSGASDALQQLVMVAASIGSEGSHFVSRKLASENVDDSSRLELLDDFLTQTTSSEVPTSHKSPKKVSGEKCAPPTHCSVESSAFLASDVAEAQTISDYSATQDPVSCTEPSTSIDHAEIRLEPKEFEALDVVYEDPISTGSHAGNFQPKLRIKKGKVNPNIPHPVMESTELPHPAHLKTGETEKSSFCAFSQGDVHNHISPTFGDFISPNPTPDFQANGESFEETTQLDEAVYGDAAHSEGICGRDKSGTIKASTVSNHRQKRKRSAADEEAKDVTSSRKSRKRLPSQQVDGPGKSTNEDNYNAESSSDHDHYEDMECTTEQRKIAPRNSKVPEFENEKPGQKHKRTKKATDEPTDKPTKKFSHSTRKNIRRADKSLVEMPEDEIDPQKIPLRDLIQLGEHNERSETRDAAKLKPPVSNQRDRVSTSSFNLNYGSFMKKSRPVKWSEQDTKLFYEVIEPFGIDFELATLLFPGLTRAQIKLKYSKEKRQNPLRIHETEHGQPKDKSKCARVIDQLLKFARQKQEDNSYQSSAMIDLEEQELTHDNNGEVTKPGVHRTEDMETDVAAGVQYEEAAEVHSPMKSNQSDHGDGFGGWDDEF